jgi:hypothetical protein
MSCWVVPTVAAELWGVSVEHVFQCIRDGYLASRREVGFTFVDIAPESSTLNPPTYTVLTPEEFAALTGSGPADEAIVAADAQTEDADAEQEIEYGRLADWRAAREQTARMRIAPRRKAG